MEYLKKWWFWLIIAVIVVGVYMYWKKQKQASAPKKIELSPKLKAVAENAKKSVEQAVLDYNRGGKDLDPKYTESKKNQAESLGISLEELALIDYIWGQGVTSENEKRDLYLYLGFTPEKVEELLGGTKSNARLKI